MNRGSKEARVLKNNFTLTFREDQTVKDDYSGELFDYRIDDDILYIGNRKYHINKLSAYELVITSQSDDALPGNPLADKLFLKKIQITFETSTT